MDTRSPGDAALMLDADDAEVVSLSPKQLRTLVGVVVVFCTAFGLTV